MGGNNYSCTFKHGIDSNGLVVKSEYAEAESPFKIVCNARIDFVYSDVNAKVYKTIRGPVQNGCTNVLPRKVNPGILQTGKACALLYGSGDLRATQCHNVFSVQQ